MTSKLTRERIELIANFHRAMTLPPSHAEIEELARMALAAMDSEPVAVIDQANLDYLRSGADADVWPPEREEMGDVLLYRHAQQPVVPDGLIAAVNRLLDSDGSRGCYSAIQCGGAHDEIERLLAAAPQEVPDGK